MHTALPVPSLVEIYFTTAQAEVDWNKEAVPDVNLNPQVKTDRWGTTQQLVQNLERSMSRLYIVNLLI